MTRLTKSSSPNFIHGLARKGQVVPELYVWNTMIQRCHNAKSQSYFRYGARGIVVCTRWRNSFQAFYEDMGPRPGSKMTLERINNDGNYEPSNCRWETRSQQAKNRRTSRFVCLNGKNQCLMDWARDLRVNHRTITRWLEAGYSLQALVELSERGLFPLKRGENLSREVLAVVA